MYTNIKMMNLFCFEWSNKPVSLIQQFNIRLVLFGFLINFSSVADVGHNFDK